MMVKTGERGEIERIPHYLSPGALLGRLGIEQPEEIIVEAIAQYCGATVLYDHLEGSDARLIGFGSRAFITVNLASPPARRRFSVAHELGHWMWDRGSSAFHCADELREYPDSENLDGMERRANRYAVGLLIPEKMFLREWGGLSSSLAAARSLATRFQMGLTATALRLVELARSPAILVATGPRRRRWYRAAPCLTTDLKVGDYVSPESVAFRLHEGGRPSRGPELVPAAAWFPLASPGAEIREEAWRSGTGVFSLLTWDEG